MLAAQENTRKDAVEHFAKIKIIATFVALRCVRCAEAQIQIKYEGVVFACDSFAFLYKNRPTFTSRAGI